MTPEELLLLINTILFGAIAFMGRRYFYRIEEHLKRNEDLIGSVVEIGLRVNDHERRIGRLEED
jgi:hypothetical protein